MGLDASVYCDCFERGTLLKPPPLGCTVVVSADGSLSHQDGESGDSAFDEWVWGSACEHEDRRLLHHRIGNIALVAALRQELNRHADQFPLLLSKVLYSGTHCGDFLRVAQVKQLRPEIERLNSVSSGDAKMNSYLKDFANQMAELADASIKIGKPISF